MSGIVLGLLLSASYSTEAAGSDEKEVIKSYNETALRLYRELEEKSENIVISPYSIGTAMSMALSGARGDTEKEMAKVLNQPLSRERMDSANAKIMDKMSRFQEEEGVVLSIANALCLTHHGDMVQESYRDLLRTKYRAELFSAQDIDPINAWVSKKTHEKIDKILENLDPESVCVLLNAIYFKGLWASQFDKKLTRPGKFYTTKDKTLSVPMMHQQADYRTITYDNFRAIAMPYKVDSLVMVIILPHEKTGLANVEEKLTVEIVQSVLSNLEIKTPHKVMLSLPRFKIEFVSSLIPAFKALGMKLAFSSAKADFAGITGRDNAPGLIWFDQIEHKAFLEVSEEGTEAAAATALSIGRSLTSILEFRVDHPFLFLLVDKATDAILFMGRVNNPLEEK
jgi:serpin B